MPIEKLTTDDITTAAALGAHGFQTLEAIPTARPGHYEFVVLVAPERIKDAEAIKAACDPRTGSYDFDVHLGAYERAHQQVRAALKKRKDLDNGYRQPGDYRPASAPPG